VIDTHLAVARVVDFYESLSPDSLARIAEVYAADARFKDPFNEVCGLSAIEKVFRHMYEQVQEPRFRVSSRMGEGDEAWLAWEFEFRFRGWKEAELQCIRGATHTCVLPPTAGWRPTGTTGIPARNCMPVCPCSAR
jgi:steroid delta-isomerase